MRLTRRDWITCVVLYFLAQIFFLINIQFPKGFDFDEFHYIPAAKQFLDLKENRNYEHPPLGKELMAVGVGVFGDRPLGWRFMSTLFGALTLVGMYLWALGVFRSPSTALYATILTFFNQLLYVQARIGMLDTFMFAFVIWGLAAFTATWDAQMPTRQVYRFLLFAGLMFGLATACKWSAVVPWFACIFLIGVVRTLQGWNVSFGKPQIPANAVGEIDWYHPKLYQGLRLRELTLALIVVPLFAYFITFLPFLMIDRTPAYTLWDLLLMQPKMWEGQMHVVTSHPYMSQWTGWPILARPIWYAFDREAGNSVRGVLLLGNPLIMWGGLLALLSCFANWISFRWRDAFLILVFYGVFYFSWAVIPRKISFYYYYYPAGMTLSLAVAYMFHHWEEVPPGKIRWARWIFAASAVAVFVYFFPILAALKIPADSFRKWMWFSSWI